MEPEVVLDLFDSSWFYLNIFPKESKIPISEPNPNPQIRPKSSKINVPRQLTIPTRSKSDQLLITKFSSDISSPTFQKPNLQTIISQKELSLEKIPKTPKINKPRKGFNRMRKRLSKSLSELEFEEMKGFMDLGFVFSEEDKEDSSLVEIIPGLQKMGQIMDCEEERGFVELPGQRSRPYLSEAWEVYTNRQMKQVPLMEWRIPAINNEIDMKDNLKWWAHSVASAVR